VSQSSFVADEGRDSSIAIAITSMIAITSTIAITPTIAIAP
jgi:hypothetical protein